MGVRRGIFGLSGGVSRWYLMEKLAINGKIKQFIYIFERNKQQCNKDAILVDKHNNI